MKTIKYILISIVILSMTMGSFSNLSAQDDILFSETYKRSEITSLFDDADRFFELLNSSKTNQEQARLGSCSEADTREVWEYLHSKEVKNRFPDDLRFAWGWSKEGESLFLYALRETPEAAPGKKDLKSVKMEKSKQTGSYSLLISLSEEGAESWARMTRENIGRNIAMVIEGKVVSAPVVQAEIKQGNCLISGNYSKEEMVQMKALLEK